jgi:hypothetical protein
VTLDQYPNPRLPGSVVGEASMRSGCVIAKITMVYRPVVTKCHQNTSLAQGRFSTSEICCSALSFTMARFPSKLAPIQTGAL